MTLYTTPLQIGYFFSLLMWLVFLTRGVREHRLSDKLLGWLMLLLALELQDYTFGFAGINILWDELNGFPRGVQLLFGPVVYFYFLSQINRDFKLQKHHFWHFAPYLLAFAYEFSAFIQGQEAVEALYSSSHFKILSYLHKAFIILSFFYYFSKCMGIYKSYRLWSLDQFSNTELISFKWFRNFIYAMIFWLLFKELMNILDLIFTLDFYQDWWWNLALVVVALYIGLAGYEQKQPAKINFQLEGEEIQERLIKTSNKQQEIRTIEIKRGHVVQRLKEVMKEERLFLQSDLSLGDLANHLQVNTAQLSAAINQEFEQNFNDFVNGFRVEEFLRQYEEDKNNVYTLLAIALNSGFNSKATFNRAFKKIKGRSPKEYLMANRETS